MPNEDFDAMLTSLKEAAAFFRDAGVEFILGGGLACWARGGPESDHDLDLMVRPRDADRALEVLSGIGMKPEQPPEGWLYKVYDENDVMIDFIFEPTGVAKDGSPFARAFFTLVEELRIVEPRQALQP